MRSACGLRRTSPIGFASGAYYLQSGSVRAALMAADVRRLHSESWQRKVEHEIRADPVVDPHNVPERRIIVPRNKRPGYVPSVASARTLQRKAQREAAKRPDAQPRKDSLQVFRILGR